MIDQVIDGIIQREGGGKYSNHPADRGGPTRWGITEARARAEGYVGDMRDLPEDKARDIYRKIYWVRPGYNRVAQVSPKVAEELSDTGVNMGAEQATRFLQRSLNVLNLDGATYLDLVVDGQVGPRTLHALRAYLLHRQKEGEDVLLKALNCLQGNRYIEISEARSEQQAFTYGWLRERVVL